MSTRKPRPVGTFFLNPGHKENIGTVKAVCRELKTLASHKTYTNKNKIARKAEPIFERNTLRKFSFDEGCPPPWYRFFFFLKLPHFSFRIVLESCKKAYKCAGGQEKGLNACPYSCNYSTGVAVKELPRRPSLFLADLRLSFLSKPVF